MKLGVMLLSANNVYVSHHGHLPKRPAFDKTFITDIIKGQRVLCSYETLQSLPKSIISAAKYFTIDTNAEYDINFGVSTFKDAPVDILFIVRNNDTMNGKKFRLEDYELMLKPTNEFEIWRKK